MPWLTYTDPLPYRPHRVLIAGTSGSGKTTLAQSISVVLSVPHVEIDALFHGPDWTPRKSFEADVDEFTSAAEWVTEWQYSQVRSLLAERADVVVWLDLSRATVMRQVVWRTLIRRARRQELWNGNVEPPLHSIFKNQDNIVRWAWTTHHKSVIRIRDLLAARPELPVVRLHSHREARAWVARLR